MTIEEGKDQSNFEFGLSDEKRGPVTCFGKSFESDEARRWHFLAFFGKDLRNY